MGVNEKRFRKRSAPESEDPSEDDEEIRFTLEEVRFLQKQRERRSGVVANQRGQPVGGADAKVADKGEGEDEKEELVLQDTFTIKTTVTVEDPNMRWQKRGEGSWV